MNNFSKAKLLKLLIVLVPFSGFAQNRVVPQDSVKFSGGYWPASDWSKPIKGYTSHYWPEGYPSTAKESDVVNTYTVEKGKVYVLRNDRAVFIPGATPAGTAYQVSDLSKLLGTKFSKKSKTNRQNQKVYWIEIQFEEANSYSLMQIFTVGDTNNVQKIALANKYFAKKIPALFQPCRNTELGSAIFDAFSEFSSKLK